MEVTDRGLNSVISLLREKREVERANYEYAENRRTAEQNDKLMKLRNLRERQAHIRENVTKNLKSLIMQKHGLQKVIQNSESSIAKLPVTHKYQQDAINFVSDAINFTNNFPEIQKLVKSESDVDTAKLCNEINLCGEMVSQELTRSKTRVDQVGTFRENTEIIKNLCFLSCDDDPGLIE